MFKLNSCNFNSNDRINSVSLSCPFNKEEIFIYIDYCFFTKNAEEYASYFNYNKSSYRIEIEKVIDKNILETNNSFDSNIGDITISLFVKNKSTKSDLLITDFYFSSNQYLNNNRSDITIDVNYYLRIYLLSPKPLPPLDNIDLRIVNKEKYTYLNLKDKNGYHTWESILLCTKLKQQYSKFNIYLSFFDDRCSLWSGTIDNHINCSYCLIFPKHLLYELFSNHKFYFTFDGLSEIDFLLTYENYYEPPIIEGYDNWEHENIGSDFNENILKIKLCIMRDAYYCSYIYDVDDNNCLIYFESENKGTYSKILTDKFVKAKIDRTGKYMYSNVHNNPNYKNTIVDNKETSVEEDCDGNWAYNYTYGYPAPGDDFWNSLEDHDKIAFDSERFLDEAEYRAEEQIEREMNVKESYERFINDYKSKKSLFAKSKPLLISNSLSFYCFEKDNSYEYMKKQYKFILPNYLSKNDQRVLDYITLNSNEFGEYYNKIDISKMRYDIEAPQLIDIKFIKHFVKEGLEYKIARHGNFVIFKIDNKENFGNIERLFNVNLIPIIYLNNPKKNCYYYCVLNNSE